MKLERRILPAVAISVSAAVLCFGNANAVKIISVDYGAYCSFAQPAPLYGQSPLLEASANGATYSSNISAVNLSDRTRVEAAPGEVLTLVMNGEERDILEVLNEGEDLPAGTYEFCATAAAHRTAQVADTLNMDGCVAQYTYRSALTVDRSGIVPKETIQQLLLDGDLSTNSATKAVTLSGGSITAREGFFNGVTAWDGGALSLDGVTIALAGDGATQWTGGGAAVYGADASAISLQDCTIQTSGVLRTGAAINDGWLQISSSLLMTGETADTDGKYEALVTAERKRAPFCLGIEGTVRAVSFYGNSTASITDSIVISSGWAALDARAEEGEVLKLTVTDTLAGIGALERVQEGKAYSATKALQGTTYGFQSNGSGTVAMAEGTVNQTFQRVRFYGPDYIQLLGAGDASATYEDSVLDSGRIAVTAWSNEGAVILKNCTVEAEDTLVQIKSGAEYPSVTAVTLDNTTVTLGTAHTWGGTLVALVESDMGADLDSVSYSFTDTPAVTSDQLETVPVTLKDGTYAGDIWNSVYTAKQTLSVTLDGAALTGIISSGTAVHVDLDGEPLAAGRLLTGCIHGDYRISSETGDYKLFGALKHTASDENPVDVILCADSAWNVTGDCYLDDLTVEAGATISASSPVTIHCTGTVNMQGTMDANVSLDQREHPKETAEPVQNDSQAFAQVSLATGTVCFIAQDLSGNILQEGVSLSSAAEGDTLDFSLTTTGCFVTKISSDGTSTLHRGGSGEYDYALLKGADEMVTVTVVVRPTRTVSRFGDDDGANSWSWAADYIYLCAAGEIIGGFEDGTYHPERSLTRAEAAKLIVCAAGLDTSGATTNLLTDLVSGAWYCPYVAAGANAGIIGGYEDGTFRPDNTITRAEFTKLVVYATGLRAGERVCSFTDVAEPVWYAQPVTIAASRGLVSGYGDGTFGPQRTITRGEAAKIIAVAFNLI